MLSGVWDWVVSRGPRAGPHRKGAVERPPSVEAESPALEDCVCCGIRQQNLCVERLSLDPGPRSL